MPQGRNWLFLCQFAQYHPPTLYELQLRDSKNDWSRVQVKLQRVQEQSNIEAKISTVNLDIQCIHNTRHAIITYSHKSFLDKNFHQARYLFITGKVKHYHAKPSPCLQAIQPSLASTGSVMHGVVQTLHYTAISSTSNHKNAHAHAWSAVLQWPRSFAGSLLWRVMSYKTYR